MSPSRNLCLFLDGTAAFAGASERSSVLYRLSAMMHDTSNTNKDQVIFYIPGPGTQKRSLLTLDAMFGKSLEHICTQAYLALATNYRRGDEIFIFGWSRGAIAARILCRIISRFGLIKAEKIDNLPTLWKKVRDINIVELDRDDESFLYPKINFLGLFDSVYFRTDVKFIRGVLSIDYLPRNNADNLLCDRSVKTAVHLIAADERLGIFPCVPFTGKESDDTILRQIIVPGCHGDVGGSKLTVCNYISLMTMRHFLIRHTDAKFYSKTFADMKITPQTDFLSVSGILGRAPSTLSEKRRRTRDYSFDCKPCYDARHPIFRYLKAHPSIWHRGKTVIYPPIPRFRQA